MLTCGGCGVARYCHKQHQVSCAPNPRPNRKHQMQDPRAEYTLILLVYNIMRCFNHQRKDLMRAGGHKQLCPLLKRWRDLQKGKDDKAACRPDLVSHLQLLKAKTHEALHMPFV